MTATNRSGRGWHDWIAVEIGASDTPEGLRGRFEERLKAHFPPTHERWRFRARKLIEESRELAGWFDSAMDELDTLRAMLERGRRADAIEYLGRPYDPLRPEPIVDARCPRCDWRGLAYGATKP